MENSSSIGISISIALFLSTGHGGSVSNNHASSCHSSSSAHPEGRIFLRLRELWPEMRRRY